MFLNIFRRLKVGLNPLDDRTLPEPFCHSLILFQTFVYHLNQISLIKNSGKSVAKHLDDRSALNRFSLAAF